MCSSVITWSFPNSKLPSLSNIDSVAEVLPTRSSLIFSHALSFSIRISSSWSFLSLESSASSMDFVLSSFSTPRLEKTLASITVPVTPGGTLSDVSCTSLAFSPKIARSNFSSGESCVSPFGVIFPTKISPAFTSAPIRIIPLSSRSFKDSSPRFGISLVISSLPNFVSLATTSNSSM